VSISCHEGGGERVYVINAVTDFVGCGREFVTVVVSQAEGGNEVRRRRASIRYRSSLHT